MAYTAPYVDETGLHYSSFQDIKEYYQDGAKLVFGSDIYVDNDSMDGQLISIFAKATYDTCKMIEYAYNNTTPQTAYGTVLSRLVLLSGLSRKKAGYSTVYCKLTGEPFTIIRNGVVQDVSGNRWNLPEIVNLGEDGVEYVTATAEKQGDITALANTVTTIVTPTFGWKSVTNEYPANKGQSVETDEELRLRQKKSVALPSQGLLQGTQSALLDLEGVTDALVKENDTDDEITLDSVLLPPHSITCIVEGGSEADIASTIFYKKNQGCYTNGDVQITQYDLYNNATTIRFYRPIFTDIEITVTVNPLQDYSSEVSERIKTNLVSYINNLGFSTDVYKSAIYSPINNANDNILSPQFQIADIRLSVLGGSTSLSTVPIPLNGKARIAYENINVEVNS